jgi:dTDP-glucose 4,6-dehydratase
MTDLSVLAGKRVLVTGAGGFIGSHVTETLVRLGAKTRALVRYVSSGHAGFLDDSDVRQDIEIVRGDIRDADSVFRAMQGVDIVLHLAALIAIPYSYEAPNSYVATNVTGTLNVLESARKLGTSRIVHTSTSEVYGTAQFVPMTEAHPLVGQSPYSASKIGADQLAHSYFCSFGTPVVTLRPFNTYGPRQSARAVIPTVISQALSGDQISLGSLRPTRDFNFVADTVDGFLRAAIYPAEGLTMHLGTGLSVSVGDVVERVSAIVGRKLHVHADDDRLRPENSEVMRLCADASFAKSKLDWQPQVSLDEGLKRTLDWISKHLSRYRPQSYAV